jgi:membrane-associated progesterone receptor component
LGGGHISAVMSLGELALYGLALAFPLAILLQRFFVGEQVTKSSEPPPSKEENSSSTTIMQAERTDLAPPKEDPFTQEELKAFDGNDPDKPVYVAIKGFYHTKFSLPPSSHFFLKLPGSGTVFDVSRKRDTYGPGGSYALFAGKDASRALGLSSLKPEDAVPDWSTLEEKDLKTLDDWHAFFTWVPDPFLFSCFLF